MTDELIGKQLGGFKIISLIGQGGMASVYRAHQASMERDVALKILPKQFALDPNFVGRFKREARVIAQLEHNNILPVYDFGEAEGYLYIAMRLVEHGTLAEQITPGQPMPLPQIRRIISQIGDALDYAHSRGIIHRDIKPTNVLVTGRNNYVLTDFGIAKQENSQEVQFTQTGSIVGTPIYMSPEQALGKTLDRRSDIYSLGVMLYQLAVGDVPYRADTPMGLVVKHIQETPPPAITRNPNLPREVNDVIMRSLAKDPNDRYDTMSDFVNALQEAIDRSAYASTARAAAPSQSQVNTIIEPPTGSQPIPTPNTPAGTTGSVSSNYTSTPTRFDQPQPVGSSTSAAPPSKPGGGLFAGLGIGVAGVVIGGVVVVVACIAIVAAFAFWPTNGPTPTSVAQPPTSTSPVVQPPTDPLASPTPAIPNFAGDYNVDGTNPNGSKYSGVASFVNTGGSNYTATWTINSDPIQTLTGSGAVDTDGRLVLTDNTGLTTTYTRNSDGTLSGVWLDANNNRGTEILTPISGAVPTPNPGGSASAIVFEDDFSSTASGWDTGSTENGSVRYSNGEYIIEVIATDWLVWGNANLTNLPTAIQIDTNGRYTGSGPEGGFGVICYYTESPRSFYYFEVGIDSYWVIVRVDGNEQTTIGGGQLSDDIPVNATNYSITAVCRFGEQSLTVNGNYIGSAFDTTLTGGDIGLIGSSYNNSNVIFNFDQITVTDLGTSGGLTPSTNPTTTLGVPTFDGGDGYGTEFVREIQPGSPQTATITDVFSAQNFVFQGQSGQQVTIASVGTDGTDTRIKLIDPNGNVFREEDDTNDLDPQITATLNATGWWTIRVDAFSTGDYTLTLR